MPASWPFPRKTNKYTRSNFVSNFGIQNTIPLSLVLKHLKNLYERVNEEKEFFRNVEVFVNGRLATRRSGIGFLGILEIPSLGVRDILLFSKSRKFKIYSLPGDFPKDTFFFRVIKRGLLKGGKHQVHFEGGENVFVTPKLYPQFVRGAIVSMDKNRGKLKIEGIKEGSEFLVISNRHCMSIGKCQEIKPPIFPKREWRILSDEGLNFKKNNCFFLPKFLLSVIKTW